MALVEIRRSQITLALITYPALPARNHHLKPPTTNHPIILTHTTHHGQQHSILHSANQRSVSRGRAPDPSLTLPDNCKWYYGHEVQVVTFYSPATCTWCAIVYPADCTLLSATSDQIHLHGRWANYLPTAVYKVREQMYKMIGERFLLGADGVAPVLHNREAPCTCLQQTASLTVVQHDVQGAGNNASDAAGQQRGSDAPDITSGSGSSGIHAVGTQEILPVLEKIYSTLEAIEQRMQHRPVDTATQPEDNDSYRRSPPTVARTPVGSSGLPNISHSETGAAGLGLFITTRSSPVSTPALGPDVTPELDRPLPDSFVDANPSPHCSPTLFRYRPPRPNYRSSIPSFIQSPVRDKTPASGLSLGNPSDRAAITPRAHLDNTAEHIRGLIREEIGRVLAAGMGSLVGSGEGGGK